MIDYYVLQDKETRSIVANGNEKPTLGENCPSQPEGQQTSFDNTNSGTRCVVDSWIQFVAPVAFGVPASTPYAHCKLMTEQLNTRS